MLENRLLIINRKIPEKNRRTKAFPKDSLLASKKDKISPSYRFVPYLYGPYSSQLQNEINILARANFLKVTRIGYHYVYEITPLGENTATQIEKEYEPAQAKRLKDCARDYIEFTTEELVNWSKELMAQDKR